MIGKIACLIAGMYHCQVLHGVTTGYFSMVTKKTSRANDRSRNNLHSLNNVVQFAIISCVATLFLKTFFRAEKEFKGL